MIPTLDDIFQAVLEAWDIDKETYHGLKNSRDRLAVSVRQLVCWLGQRYGYTQSRVGLYLGITHSTVWHNKKMCEDYMTYDKDYKLVVYKALTSLYEKENIQEEITVSWLITRDERGDLTLWSEEPSRNPFANREGFWFGESPRLDPALFPQITWENEPQECEIKITLK